MQNIRRNGIAGSLANPAFRQRKVRPRKGRGSYSRKGRSKGLPFSFARGDNLLTLTNPMIPVNHVAENLLTRLTT